MAITASLVSQFLATSVSQISQPESIGILNKSFNKSGLIAEPVNAGKAKKSKERLVGLIRSSDEADIKKWTAGIDSARPTMVDLYSDHKRKVNISFYVSTLSALSSVFIIFWIIFDKSVTVQNLKILMGCIPTFLSLTVFWVYRFESRKMEALEGDIRSIDLLKEKLGILSLIDDPFVAEKILKKL